MQGNRLKSKCDVMETDIPPRYLTMSFFSESKGPIRTDKDFLHCGFYKFVDALTKPGNKKSKEISSSLIEKEGRLEEKLE
jgi:hypothetical protein